MPRAILFDLDGTLVDTRAASWELFAETNARFALGVDTREDFFRAFEGNFFESLAKICPTASAPRPPSSTSWSCCALVTSRRSSRA